MHHLYQTEAIILRSSNTREADRFIRAFTRDFGMVEAGATGVRHLKSKLRYSLQECSLVSLTLVKGKASWRITNAAPIRNFFSDLRGDEQKDLRKSKLAVRILKLTARLVAGEEPHPELFRLVHEGLSTLVDMKEFSREQEASFECLFVLRLLRELGYVGENAALAPFATSFAWDEPTLLDFAPIRSEALRTVNAALKESQL